MKGHRLRRRMPSTDGDRASCRVARGCREERRRGVPGRRSTSLRRRVTPAIKRRISASMSCSDRRQILIRIRCSRQPRSDGTSHPGERRHVARAGSSCEWRIARPCEGLIRFRKPSPFAGPISPQTLARIIPATIGFNSRLRASAPTKSSSSSAREAWAGYRTGGLPRRRLIVLKVPPVIFGVKDRRTALRPASRSHRCWADSRPDRACAGFRESTGPGRCQLDDGTAVGT